MPHRALAALVTILGLVAVAACGSDDASDTESDQTPTRPTNSGRVTPDADDLDDEKLGRQLAGKPKDLLWDLGKPPSSWQEQDAGKGKRQWVPAKYCVITFDQPAGFDDAREMTEEEYIDKYIANMDSVLDLNLDVSDYGERKLPVRTNSDATGYVKVSRARLSGAKDTAGEIYAHIEGNFGLVLVSMCANGYFDEVNRGEFEPYIKNQVGIAAKY